MNSGKRISATDQTRVGHTSWEIVLKVAATAASRGAVASAFLLALLLATARWAPAQQKPYSMASPEGPTDRGQTGRSPFFPNFIKCGTYARADFTSVREKSCPLNSSGSPLVFASA
jgi:hypothetical protein